MLYNQLYEKIVPQSSKLGRERTQTKKRDNRLLKFLDITTDLASLELFIKDYPASQMIH
jgi:hypothetical protein